MYKKIALFLAGLMFATLPFGSTLATNLPQSSATPTPAPVPSSYGKLGLMTSLIPAQPDFNVKSYIVIDAKSGAIIAAKNQDEHLAPASLTKIMTLYLIADSLKAGKIKPTDLVPISERAWRMEGSRMFAKVGSTVPVQQLIDGIIIASGNDATVAMAEFLGGSEDSFVDLMNQTAALLGMKDTHFTDSNGLPANQHYSSARDLATLSRAWINNFPEYYPWFKTKWITYNGIKQPNRNRLLWRDPSVDGIKTGHTSDAGYCLAASAVRNNMRLITIVMGAQSDRLRTSDSQSLLNYGFRFFETHKLYAANTALVNAKIKDGKEKTTPLGVAEDFYVTSPINQYKHVKVNATINTNLAAPIRKGQICGSLTATLNGKEISARPLIALADNPMGGLLDRIIGIFKF